MIIRYGDESAPATQPVPRVWKPGLMISALAIVVVWYLVKRGG